MRCQLLDECGCLGMVNFVLYPINELLDNEDSPASAASKIGKICGDYTEIASGLADVLSRPNFLPAEVRRKIQRRKAKFMPLISHGASETASSAKRAGLVSQSLY